jgi:hypothetical protein
MKKVAILVSSVILFAGLTFGQTPKTQEKPQATPAKTESPAAKKDGKDCEKTCTHKGKTCTDKEKAGCCAKKSEGAKKEVKTTTPEKK